MLLLLPIRWEAKKHTAIACSCVSVYAAELKKPEDVVQKYLITDQREHMDMATGRQTKTELDCGWI